MLSPVPKMALLFLLTNSISTYYLRTRFSSVHKFIESICFILSLFCAKHFNLATNFSIFQITIKFTVSTTHLKFNYIHLIYLNNHLLFIFVFSIAHSTFNNLKITRFKPLLWSQILQTRFQILALLGQIIKFF